MSGSGLYIIKP